MSGLLASADNSRVTSTDDSRIAGADDACVASTYDALLAGADDTCGKTSANDAFIACADDSAQARPNDSCSNSKHGREDVSCFSRHDTDLPFDNATAKTVIRVTVLAGYVLSGDKICDVRQISQTRKGVFPLLSVG
jgi:hypothetical protein